MPLRPLAILVLRTLVRSPFLQQCVSSSRVVPDAAYTWVDLSMIDQHASEGTSEVHLRQGLSWG